MVDDEVLRRKQEVKEHIMKTEKYLHIKKCPSDSVNGFITWANEEYDGDWGYAFKYMWDVFSSVIPRPSELQLSRFEEIEHSINVLSNDINYIKSQLTVDKDKRNDSVKRAVDGTPLGD